MSGKTGGGTGDGEDGVISKYMGSVLTAIDLGGFGGVQAVEAGAKKLNFLLPFAGKTKRLSELALHRKTRSGVGSIRNTIEPGWASSVEEAPRSIVEKRKQRVIRNPFRQSKKDRKTAAKAKSCQARNYSRAVKYLIS